MNEKVLVEHTLSDFSEHDSQQKNRNIARRKPCKCMQRLCHRTAGKSNYEDR